MLSEKQIGHLEMIAIGMAPVELTTGRDVMALIQEVRAARKIVAAIADASQQPKHGGCPFCDMHSLDPRVASVMEHEAGCPIGQARAFMAGKE